MNRWAITRDGEVVSVHDTNAEAFGRLLRLQPHSVHHAITHEGWDIVEVRDEEQVPA